MRASAGLFRSKCRELLIRGSFKYCNCSEPGSGNGKKRHFWSCCTLHRFASGSEQFPNTFQKDGRNFPPVFFARSNEPCGRKCCHTAEPFQSQRMLFALRSVGMAHSGRDQKQSIVSRTYASMPPGFSGINPASESAQESASRRFQDRFVKASRPSAPPSAARACRSASSDRFRPGPPSHAGRNSTSRW